MKVAGHHLPQYYLIYRLTLSDCPVLPLWHVIIFTSVPLWPSSDYSTGLSSRWWTCVFALSWLTGQEYLWLLTSRVCWVRLAKTIIITYCALAPVCVIYTTHMRTQSSVTQANKFWIQGCPLIKARAPRSKCHVQTIADSINKSSKANGCRWRYSRDAL